MGYLQRLPEHKTDQATRFRDAANGAIGYLNRSGATVTFVEVDDYDTDTPDGAAPELTGIATTPAEDVPADEGDSGS